MLRIPRCTRLRDATYYIDREIKPERLHEYSAPGLPNTGLCPRRSCPAVADSGHRVTAQPAALGTIDTTTVQIDGRAVRVSVRPGKGRPLLLINGIGANLELLAPVMHALDGIETIAFDVPGVGGSALPWSPYRMSGLARLVDRMLERLGYQGAVDVLGLSWGGALAQQFAITCKTRCHKLVLAATSPGALMVPGSPLVLAKMFNSRRYTDIAYLRRIAPSLYGGEVRRNPGLVENHRSLVVRPHWRGYLYQQLALCGWSSLPWLPFLRQRTLVLAGNDDPLVPLINARLMAKLIPRSRLEIMDDGHLFLLTHPERVAPLIRGFLAEPLTR